MMKHSLSVTGQEGRTGYNLSISYTDNPGLIKDTGYQRYFLRANVYSDITKWLRIGTRVWGYHTDQKKSDTGSLTNINTQKMIPGVYPYYDGKYGAPEANEEDPQSHNPLWDMAQSEGHIKNTQFFTTFYANVKFLKHFSYDVNLNYKDYRYESMSVNTDYGKYSFSTDQWIAAPKDPADLYTRMAYVRENHWKLTHLLNYNQTFYKHDIGMLLGFEEERFVKRTTDTAKVIKGDHFASVTIEHQHTNITRIEKDGEVILDNPYQAECKTVIEKSKLTVKDILDFADQVRIEDVQPIIDRQIKLNSAIAQEGLDNNYGAQIGKTLMHVWGKSVTTRACARAAAGSDARMGGCSMPVVINSGSGNQGMTVSLPVIVFADEWEVSHEKLCRSLVVSNLIAIHQKYYIGSLSAYCGAVSAACGAGAGITYMYGGTYQQVSLTIINTLGNVGGIVCDGAKPSCAAKIASSVDAALMAFQLSIQNKSFLPGEGIIKDDIEETIKSMGYIGRVGMRSTDTEILNVMIDRADINQGC